MDVLVLRAPGLGDIRGKGRRVWGLLYLLHIDMTCIPHDFTWSALHLILGSQANLPHSTFCPPLTSHCGLACSVVREVGFGRGAAQPMVTRQKKMAALTEDSRSPMSLEGYEYKCSAGVTLSIEIPRPMRSTLTYSEKFLFIQKTTIF